MLEAFFRGESDIILSEDSKIFPKLAVCKCLSVKYLSICEEIKKFNFIKH